MVEHEPRRGFMFDPQPPETKEVGETISIKKRVRQDQMKVILICQFVIKLYSEATL